MSTIAEQYLRAWDQVLATADAVAPSGWDAPSPCEGWTAGHLAVHLIDAAHQTDALLAGHARPAATGDVGALRVRAGAEPARPLRDVADPLLGRVRQRDASALVITPHGALPADQFLAMVLVEPVIHGWDLATRREGPQTTRERHERRG